MKVKKFKYLIGDFETTVYDSQDYTEVWASAVVEMYTEDVKIFHSISETFHYLTSLNENVCIYYHNLKFDGAFWLSFLIHDLHYEQAKQQNSESQFDISFLKDYEMKNKTFKYLISDMGEWYTIKIRVNDHFIEIRDSLKLLPFSVKRIGDAFKTKHRKLEMEYTGYRYAGCVITDEEKKYIANDVLVVKEALEVMFDEGHKKLTIGACCLDEFKRTLFEAKDYERYFPDLTAIPLDSETFGSENVDQYIRKSYKGGWCYLVKGRENKIIENGITADVNSLYPSMMSGESGNYYPIGLPTFWHGNYIPDEARASETYFYIRIKTKFYLKKNKLPCIQIKGKTMYSPTEWLETSDIWSKRDKCYYDKYIDIDGNVQEASVVLTLTMTDFALITDHYYLVDYEILDGCYFQAQKGLFDIYINKYKKIKLESKGAKRELAKLFLNNLYGKMASNNNSSFKYAFLREDEAVGFADILEFNKKAGYIAIGSAITSYARNFTIRTAQKNFYGANKHGFIYADTDSIHCDLKPEELQGVPVHDRDFCCWKLEASWDKAIFVRQKTYMEHVVAENLEPCNPYLNIKCAGMPERCKNLYQLSMKGWDEETWKHNDLDQWNKFTEDEKKFVTVKRTMEDFKVGLVVPSKLLPKRIKGGIVLQETTYEMR